jgi:polyhydroxyalkanoate synthesis regulator protein
MNKNFDITYYKNRKLYSHQASRYVNLNECKQLIDAGYNVRFIEHQTGIDVTRRCLMEMLCKFSVDQTELLNLLQKVK